VACFSPFLFLSPSTSLSSARFRIRSWSARPNSVTAGSCLLSAFTFVTVPTGLPDPFEPSRLEAANVPPAPRRETAAWQPRCFLPLGIDVHGDRSLCVHRQVLRPRGRLFDQVPLPLEEGDSPLRFGEAAPFFTSRFCPTSTVSSSASNFGGPLAEHRFDESLVNFLVGVATASCGSVVPDKSSKGACAPLDAGLEPRG